MMLVQAISSRLCVMCDAWSDTRVLLPRSRSRRKGNNKYRAVSNDGSCCKAKRRPGICQGRRERARARKSRSQSW